MAPARPVWSPLPGCPGAQAPTGASRSGSHCLHLQPCPGLPPPPPSLFCQGRPTPAQSKASVAAGPQSASPVGQQLSQGERPPTTAAAPAWQGPCPSRGHPQPQPPPGSPSARPTPCRVQSSQLLGPPRQRGQSSRLDPQEALHPPNTAPHPCVRPCFLPAASQGALPRCRHLRAPSVSLVGLFADSVEGVCFHVSPFHHRAGNHSVSTAAGTSPEICLWPCSCWDRLGSGTRSCAHPHPPPRRQGCKVRPRVWRPRQGSPVALLQIFFVLEKEASAFFSEDKRMCSLRKKRAGASSARRPSANGQGSYSPRPVTAWLLRQSPPPPTIELCEAAPE